MSPKVLSLNTPFLSLPYLLDMRLDIHINSFSRHLNNTALTLTHS